MKTIIVLIMLNGLSGNNNFSYTSISGFESLSACESAKQKIHKELDLTFSNIERWKCIEVKK